MKELFKVLIDSKNCSDTSTILKTYGIKFRGDYIEIIDYLISSIIKQDKKIDELKTLLEEKPITLKITHPVNVEIAKKEIEVL